MQVTEEHKWIEVGIAGLDSKFHAFIIKFGLTQRKADPCVYFQPKREGEIDEVLTVLINYIDDGIIFSNRK